MASASCRTLRRSSRLNPFFLVVPGREGICNACCCSEGPTGESDRGRVINWISESLAIPSSSGALVVDLEQNCCWAFMVSYRWLARELKNAKKDNPSAFVRKLWESHLRGKKEIIAPSKDTPDILPPFFRVSAEKFCSLRQTATVEVRNVLHKA